MSKSSTNADGDNVLVIGAVQCPLRADDEHPLEATCTAIQLMKQTSHNNNIDLFVLPELAPLGYSEDTFQRYLPSTIENQELYRKIHEQIVNAAMELNAHVSYGTIGIIQNDAFTEKQDSLTIRQVVVAPSTGATIASYDKMLLCDYGDCAETRFFVPGQELASFSIRNFRLGIILCADMRNPMYARELTAKHNVDVLLQPAAFPRDVSFRTWKSFRETRAVENSVYFVGANYSGDNNFGESSFTEPWVDQEHEPIVMGCEAGVLVGRVERLTLNHVRTTMPFFQQALHEKW